MQPLTPALLAGAPARPACPAAGRPPPGDGEAWAGLPAERGEADPAPLEAPFPHGPFLVEPDGALHATGIPALRFAWRGHPCEARIAEGRVHLSAAAGALPYTAEQPAIRPGAVATVLNLPAELPRGWRLRVLPDHRLRLETERPLPAPTTAIALVTALVGFALALDPWLDRLEASGVAGAATR